MATVRAVRDLTILIARVGVGVVFVAHGWQKLVTDGVPATAASFRRMGVPMPTISAWYSALAELLCGAALVLGLAVPVAAVLLVLNMLGAYLFVHAGHGIFIQKSGAELVIALGAASLLLATSGAGRLSLDHLIVSGRRTATRAPSGRPGGDVVDGHEDELKPHRPGTGLAAGEWRADDDDLA